MVGWISGATTLRIGFVFLAVIAATLTTLSGLVATVPSRTAPPARQSLSG
jgi:hypothetical protein